VPRSDRFEPISEPRGPPEDFDLAVDLLPGHGVAASIQWRQTYAESVGKFYSEALPWLRTLGAPDDVWIVFGFG
jgi:hypothetical protein